MNTGPRRLGLLGGMSWQSTEIYYRLINEGVAAALGGLHSAELLLDSLDFAALEALQRRDDWTAMGEELARRARALETAGAEAILIGSNTMHRVAPQVQAAIGVPLIHLVDEIARAASDHGWHRLGLLGTRFTMTGALFPERLGVRNIEVVVPGKASQALVDEIIFEELCHGQIHAGSRDRYLGVVEELADRGCEAVILGCTEIGLLLDSDELCPLPRIDSAAVHAAAAVRFALNRD